MLFARFSMRDVGAAYNVLKSPLSLECVTLGI